MRFWNSIGRWYGALMMPLVVGMLTGCGWSAACAAVLTAAKVGISAADHADVLRAWLTFEQPRPD